MDKELRKVVKFLCERQGLAWHEDSDGTIDIRQLTMEELSKAASKSITDFLTNPLPEQTKDS